MLRTASWIGRRSPRGPSDRVGPHQFRPLCADGFVDGKGNQGDAGGWQQANERLFGKPRRVQKDPHQEEVQFFCRRLVS